MSNSQLKSNVSNVLMMMTVIAAGTLSALPNAQAMIGNGCDNNPSSYCHQNAPVNAQPVEAPAPRAPGEQCYGNNCYIPSPGETDTASSAIEDDELLIFSPEVTAAEIATALTQIKNLRGHVKGLLSVQIVMDSTPAYNGGVGGYERVSRQLHSRSPPPKGGLVHGLPRCSDFLELNLEEFSKKI
jgi:hypothetical protein